MAPWIFKGSMRNAILVSERRRQIEPSERPFHQHGIHGCDRQCRGSTIHSNVRRCCYKVWLEFQGRPSSIRIAREANWILVTAWASVSRKYDRLAIPQSSEHGEYVENGPAAIEDRRQECVKTNPCCQSIHQSRILSLQEYDGVRSSKSCINAGDAGSKRIGAPLIVSCPKAWAISSYSSSCLCTPACG
jgi:hypothetical protein